MVKKTHFFDLPLELRNIVYSELADGQPIVVGYWDNGFSEDAVLKPYVRPLLLRISHQFKLEYEREVFRNAQLRLLISGLSSYGEFNPPSIKNYAFMKTRHVQIRIPVHSINIITSESWLPY